MIDWSQCCAVERAPGKVGGAWLFKNTRVPLEALFENLEGGATIDEFLKWFPGVERAQVEAVLEHARRSLKEIPSQDGHFRRLLLEGAASAAAMPASKTYFAELRRRLADGGKK